MPVNGEKVQTIPSIVTFSSNRDQTKRNKYLKVVKKLLDYEKEEMRKIGKLLETEKIVKFFYE